MAQLKQINSCFTGAAQLTVCVPLSDGIIWSCLQVEPYSGVLFWSCSEQNTINVTRLNGSQVGVVVGGPDGADRPRHLALMPEHGLMAWTNLRSPARIELCRLDGSRRRALVSDLERPPSALTADPDTQLVYWADLQKIWVTDLNGSA